MFYLRATASFLLTTGKPVCATGKTLRVFLCTEFCPLCDKQVIASAPGQLKINFTCIFKVSGNFVKTLKIRVKLILKCPRDRAITNYVITESEVVTGKSQTEALPY